MSSASSQWSLPFCPAPPDWQIDWHTITARFHWLVNSNHQERQICAELIALPAWQQLSITERSILFAGVLMQNVTKSLPTALTDDVNLATSGTAHNRARIARDYLWQMLDPVVPFYQRESIVALIRFANLPFSLLERRDPTRAVITASITARCDWLALIAEAIARAGNVIKPSAQLDQIELFREYCREQHCYDGPRQFASPQSRFIYFHKENSDPDYQAFDDTRFEVVMMSGLPASGKDHYIKERLSGWPVISLDDIRAELKVPAHKNQGIVVTTAKSRAREFLRINKPFVWNATNVTRPMRQQLIDLFTSYRARVKIVYCDADYQELLRRNHARKMTVPRAVINRMADRLDIPDLTEAQQVIYQD